MGTWGTILRTWDLEPSIIVGCIGLVVGDLALGRWRSRHVSVRFLLGVAVLLLALVSPLDVLSDDYLFSAHMLRFGAALMVLGGSFPFAVAVYWVLWTHREASVSRRQGAVPDGARRGPTSDTAAM